MKKPKGRLSGYKRTDTMDAMAELVYDGFVGGVSAQLMADELGIRYGHLLDEKAFCTAIGLAQHKFLTEHGSHWPQYEPVRQAQAAPELKSINGGLWPPISSAMK